MGLVTAARFATLSEAYIAAGAQRSSGVTAEVFDAQLGQTDWLMQTALGGFRLMVPDEELLAAIDVLGDTNTAAPETSEALAAPVVPWRRRALAALLALLTG